MAEPDVQPPKRRGRQGQEVEIGPRRATRKQIATSIGFYDGDIELIKFIKETLATPSMADAVRTSVRAYALHLEIINRRRGQN